MSLIDHILPFVDTKTSTGRPVSVVEIREHLLTSGVKFDYKDKRSIVCTMSDHTINSSHKGRPDHLDKYFWRIREGAKGDHWISLKNLPAYEQRTGFKIIVKEAQCATSDNSRSTD